jgi:hypothetical protein
MLATAAVTSNDAWQQKQKLDGEDCLTSLSFLAAASS